MTGKAVFCIICKFCVAYTKVFISSSEEKMRGRKKIADVITSSVLPFIQSTLNVQCNAKNLYFLHRNPPTFSRNDTVCILYVQSRFI